MSRLRPLSASLAAIAVVALPACSFLLSVDKAQCASGADCLAKGYAGVCSDGMCVPSASADAGADAQLDADTDDPIWGCVGRVTWPPEDGTKTVVQTQRILHLLDETPLVGVKVHACRGLDISCSSPLTESTTDATGTFSFKVPYGFRGFLEGIPPPDSGVMTLLSPFLPPPFVDQVADLTEPMHCPTEAELGGLLDVIKRKVNPDTGHAFGLAVDCQGRPVAGVRLEATPVGPDSVPYYADETRLPSVTLSETTSRGEMGIVNLPPGPVTFRYFVGSRLVGTVTAQIRKGAVSAIAFAPTPSVQ